ncbi:PAS domain-containing sensor histidine kinase [Halalkalirubrum salinum]|uniref:PAS domain-containing sensor histidine kinase n=1 Tax=Halalkalirubrum salinum TaxID=2563889 RepID=UPI0010FB92EF|nr:PAS domain S-box protein [Halalkalirubrum salinum]
MPDRELEDQSPTESAGNTPEVDGAFFTHSPDPAVRYSFSDGEPIVTAVNPAFESVFGISANAIIGQSLDERVVSADGGDPTAALITQIRSGESIDTAIHRETTNDDRYFRLRTFELSGTEPTQWYAVYTETTEETARARRLERYELLVESVGDPMYVLSADGVIECVNRAMADSLGIDRAEIVGKRPDAFLTDDSVERAIETLREIEAHPERRHGRFEMTVEHGGELIIIGEAHVTVLTDKTGESIGSVGVVRDITDRSQYEQTFETLQQTTRSLLSSKTVKQTVQTAVEATESVLNSAFVTVLLVNEKTDRLEPTAVSQELLDLYEMTESRLSFDVGEGLTGGAFVTGEPAYYPDITKEPNLSRENPRLRSVILHPLGEHGLLLIGSDLFDDFDQIDRDFAEILAATTEAALDGAAHHDALKQREQELQRQNDRLEAFASVVSHDLRNPMNVAQGYTNLLEAAIDDDDALGYLHRTTDALDRMETLINNLLSLAREGTAVENPVPVAIDSVAADAWASTAPDTATVTIDVDMTVAGDRSRLQQLFENLFSNAVEHAGERVTVTVRAIADGDERGFYVADDGPGVDSDIAESVFEWGVTSDAEGTGLGLAIVSEIADAHGWDVRVQSDNGARFELRWPSS